MAGRSQVHERAKIISRGNVKREFVPDLTTMSLKGQIRPVVLLAQMGKNHPSKPFGGLADECGRLLVGKMPAAAPDSSLQRRRVRPCCQHARIVVAFEVCGVQRRQQAAKRLELVPEVRQDPESASVVLDHEY